MRFVDTNVLIYAALDAPADAVKRRRARALLREPNLALSVQVLQEFYWRATHPTRPGRLAHQHAMAFLRLFRDKPIQHLTREIFEQAVAISHRFQLSYWDGAILAAARAAGCDAVYSEDFSAEQDYDGLRVINPFHE
jgi:predicted nucleic acid-binding protein